MLRRLSSGLETGREEARQLLRKASSRFSGLLSGYRSLSVHSDDFDRHEYGASLRTLCPTHTWIATPHAACLFFRMYVIATERRTHDS